MDAILKVAETAEYLGLSEPAFRQMRYRKEGPPAVKMGTRLRFRQSELDAWLDARLESGKPATANP